MAPWLQVFQVLLLLSAWMSEITYFGGVGSVYSTADELQTSPSDRNSRCWSGAVILGRCVHPGLVCRRQLAAVVGKRRGTRGATHKDHDRSEGLCRGWPGHLEQPPCQPADFITIQRYICEKTQNSFIWLRALLGSSLIGRYTN